MKNTFQKLLVLLLVFGAVFSSSAAFAAEVEKPQYVSLRLEKDESGNYNRFTMSWQNPAWVKEILAKGETVQFEIDGKVDYEPWSSKSGIVYRGEISAATADGVSISIPPEAFAHLKDVKVTRKLYSFRVRYAKGDLRSEYSNAVAVGYRPSFSNSSQWSMEELSAAGKHGFIPPGVRSDMKRDITREEFTEVIVRVYEKANRVHLVAGDSPYVDTKNPSVIVATRLGLVQGVGYKHFDPEAKINRQEMATILARFLHTFDIEADKSNTKTYADHEKIRDFAVEPVYTLQSIGLMEGYEDGTFRPRTSASREQGVVLGERFYNFVTTKQ